MILLVMAAGMGSRYGGLKQLDPIGPNGEFILDYTAYDAMKAGFDKVVFIIKRENLDIFRETIGNRISGKLDVQYAFQDIANLPDGMSLPEGRVKQWGTAHAVLSAKDLIKGSFAAVNADDLYGFESFRLLHDYMKANDSAVCMSGFVLKNTLTENGTVSRGECSVDSDGMLTNIRELTKIKRLEDGNTAFFEDDRWNPIDENSIVSMNCWGLPEEFMSYAECGFRDFLKENSADLTKCEYYLPNAVSNYLSATGKCAKVLRTGAKWYGVTYKEDRQTVVDFIRCCIESGVYPENLWK